MRSRPRTRTRVQRDSRAARAAQLTAADQLAAQVAAAERLARRADARGARAIVAGIAPGTLIPAIEINNTTASTPRAQRAGTKESIVMKTLAQAIHVALHVPDSALHVAVNGMVGCPPGGWGETEQAYQRLLDAAPNRSQRDWTIGALLDAVLIVDHAGRYAWRRE
jgi:hypothetical protein